jgi:hypothetical protein
MTSLSGLESAGVVNRRLVGVRPLRVTRLGGLRGVARVALAVSVEIEANTLAFADCMK